MKILLIHDHYQQYGGEDAVSNAVSNLLNEKGEQVYLYERSNLEINDLPIRKKINALVNMHWSKETYKEMKLILREFFRPDVVHVFNTFFTITPSVYYACKDEGIPVVQSLYNYRMMCANALFLRNNQHCTDCIKGNRWKSVLYPCYRNSRILTALVVQKINQHWKMGTWNKMVDRYITVTNFAREKFIEAGVAEEKIVTQPHFLLNKSPLRTGSKDYALYVGRLSPEKGVHVLLKAWESVRDTPLKILGGGPLLINFQRTVREKRLENVEVLGYRPDAEYTNLLRGAKYLIVPSISYDNFPRTIIEAYSNGVPVLASEIKGIKEFVKDEVSGRLFKVGDADDLRAKVQWFSDNDQKLLELNQGAREEFDKYYTAEVYYPFLMSTYKEVIENNNREHFKMKQGSMNEGLMSSSQAASA